MSPDSRQRQDVFPPLFTASRPTLSSFKAHACFKWIREAVSPELELLQIKTDHSPSSNVSSCPLSSWRAVHSDNFNFIHLCSTLILFSHLQSSSNFSLSSGFRNEIMHFSFSTCTILASVIWPPWYLMENESSKVLLYEIPKISYCLSSVSS
jgi:hypothetical protein